MAEILLSLTIIGVIAAITLPTLVGNINERTWSTQRKALYARFSQAMALMPNINGYGTYRWENDDDGNLNVLADNAAETFVTDGLAKVLKINNVCAAEQLADCGISSNYKNLVGSTKSFPTNIYELNSAFIDSYNHAWRHYENPHKNINTKAAAFETANGESVAVFYNPFCTANLIRTGMRDGEHYSQPLMCANFIYDLNGKKGPNTVGKDIGFITALYPSDPVIVAPMPLPKSAGSRITQYMAGAACTSQNPDSRLPDMNEVAAIFYNKDLTGISANLWSSSLVSADRAWVLEFGAGLYNIYARTESYYGTVWCIQR